MEPSEFYTSMLVIPNKIAAIVGLDVFSKDYKTVSANLMGLISIYVLFAYVSVCTVVEVRHDVNDLIYCLVTVGIGLQGVMKIFTFLRYRKDLVWIQDYSKALYKEEGETHRAVLMDDITIMNVLTKIILGFYGFTSVFMLLAPMIKTYLTGHKYLTFGFWLPYIDRFSWLGYFCNFVMQFIMSVVITSENMGPDTIYFMTMMNSVTQIDLLMIKLRDVCNKIENHDFNIKEDLKDIFKRHQEHLLYVRNVEKIYRSYFFVLFSSLGATLVLVLYAIVTRAWIAGYTSCIFIIYEFFIFCYLPTLLEMKKEKLQQEIYNLPWYKMTTSDQKSVRLFLEATQQPNCLTMIFYPMNMPSFMEVMKIIYSILTLLLTIRNE
uniref:Odorant receptor n=2 Tax=Culex quinquefasciatus TaxID=7176 RepID=A0A1S4JE29_CULQU